MPAEAGKGTTVTSTSAANRLRLGLLRPPRASQVSPDRPPTSTTTTAPETGSTG